MKTVKVSPDRFEKMVRTQMQHCRFIKIPSNKPPYIFTGLIMAEGAWVSWPDNLTPEEMELYIAKYGDIPDIFKFNPKKDEIGYLPADTFKEKPKDEDKN
jgi:hypothetical protein